MIFLLALPLTNVSQFPFSENFDPIMKSSGNLKGLDQTFTLYYRIEDQYQIRDQVAEIPKNNNRPLPNNRPG